MLLSWNEIRARAAAFSREWADSGYEKGETHSFYDRFFNIFGIQRRSVARYERHVRKLDNSHGYIDLFWPGVLLVEQKSVGRNLAKAREQAERYFDALAERERPRYLLLSDFQTFELLDLDAREEVRFALDDLARNIEHFGFMIGVRKRKFRDQDPVNVHASELMGSLHDSLRAAGYLGHDLELLLVRTVFCLFADDTGIFDPRDLFLDFVERRTSEDGSDLGSWLARLFQVLATPVERRQKNLDEDLARFPYVNGDLFEEKIAIAEFDAGMREQLAEACEFDWSAISPAIFGSLFQSVMDPGERREQGAHYTTERNILKVIEPLFLDDLRERLARIRARRDTRRRHALLEFRQSLADMNFLDPACGCGNFLIVAYREIRELELEVLRELVAYDRTERGEFSGILDTVGFSAVTVGQFYGIEIGEFPTRIAETALWMMDHLMNCRLSLEFGQNYVRIPLGRSPRILHADALQADWSGLLPPQSCDYVLGNPPFSGFVLRREDLQARTGNVLTDLGAGGSRLDYVAAWFLKAAEYLRGGRARIAFVATNSITQGEQVAQLWPAIFGSYGLEIHFAHRTFPWGSDARGAAHVNVVVLGLRDRQGKGGDRRLFSFDRSTGETEERRTAAISPYLLDAGRFSDPHLVVRRRGRSVSGFPRIGVGSKPVDGGHYILDDGERERLVGREPGMAQYVRPFVGGREHINGSRRWIVLAPAVPPAERRAMPALRELVREVRRYRASEGGELAKSLADAPAEFHVTVVPRGEYLVIPEVSSERRRYVPIGYLSPPAVPSNQLLVVEEAGLGLFALLTSSMHMAWLRTVGGKLTERLRYSSGLVYNTFPGPGDGADLSSLEPLAQAVLDARSAHADASLGDLYDPDGMPRNLRDAHERLDRAVDRLYGRGGFQSEQERLEHLFRRYEQLVAPVSAARAPAVKRARKKEE